MRAAVIDADGVAVNVVEYDPRAEFEPGNGFTVEALDEDSPVSPGYRRTPDRQWEPPATVEPEPSLADRLAAVESEVQGMRERAAALAVTGGAASVRDAITGPAR